MDPPPQVVFHHDLSWSLKEPVVVKWQDELAQTQSLGHTCLQGSTQLTLWIGDHAESELSLVMIQLTLTKRIAKRIKTFDLFMTMHPRSCLSGDMSTILSTDVIHEVRPRLQHASGEPSSRRCLRVPFALAESGPCNVLMNIQPEGAKPFTGTALHLLMLFRSLSQAKAFDVYISYSDYAKLSLSAFGVQLRGGNVRVPEVDLLRSYQHGGIYNDWFQYNHEHFKPSQQHVPTAPPPYESAQDRDAEVSKSTPSRYDKVGDITVSCSTTVSLAEPGLKGDGYNDVQSTHPSPAPLKRAGLFCLQESSSKAPKLLSPFENPEPSRPDLHLPAYSKEPEAQCVLSDAATVQSVSPSTPNSNIIPTIFTKKQSPHNDISSSRLYREDIRKTTERASNSPHRLLNSTHFRSLLLSKAEDIISQQLPQLTHDVLQQNMDAFLDNVQDNHQLAGVELEETVNEAKTDLHSTRDQGIDTIEEYARECLVDFETELDAIMNNAATALESKTIELKQRLDGHWRALRKNAKEESGLDSTISTRLRQRSTSVLTDSIAEKQLSTSTAAAATRLFMREHEDLSMEAKVIVLEKLATDRTADVWMNVDKEMRGALIVSWTARGGQNP